jgi:hypothetical protein
MNASDLKKLAALRSDYGSTTGCPFDAFYCPILFRDDDVELCRAHLVNQAFANASRRWTIQRKDVDGFYGAFFESDFVKLQLRRERDEEPFSVLADRRRAQQLEPAVFLDGKKIDHYVARGEVPAQHSKFAVDFRGQTVSLGLKMHPDETLKAAAGNWEIRIEKDVRLGALVSLLKAAHLALFDMLGYRYALSAGGHFLGSTVLGDFFLRNTGLHRATIMTNAFSHFGEFANMVRPALGVGNDAKGTADDGLLYICTRGTEIRWAFLVQIRTGDSLHAVLVPTFDDPQGIEQFLRFLKNDDQTIDAALTQFDGDKWLIAKELKRLHWPKPAALS